MEQDFVTYEQAKELFDMGLRVPIAMRGYVRQYGEMILTDNVYDGHYALEAPLKSQTFRWFREKYNYWSYVYPYIHDKTWHFHIQFYDSDMWGEVFLGNNFNTYEEAENACIDKLIELAKQQDNGN